jgi:hypothetical protein
MQLAEEPAFLAMSTRRGGEERGRAGRDWLIATVAEVEARTTNPASEDALEEAAWSLRERRTAAST